MYTLIVISQQTIERAEGQAIERARRDLGIYSKFSGQAGRRVLGSVLRVGRVSRVCANDTFLARLRTNT